MADAPDLLTAARRLAAQADQMQVDAAALVVLVEASIPKTPDGKAIPPRQLDAAREIVANLLAAGMRPSMTAVAVQLRLEGFRLVEGAEQVIWRHVAPPVDAQPEVPGETEGQGGTVASLPGSSVLLDGHEWREAG